MEGRILVAVLASIVALAVGVNGGTVDNVDLSSLNSEERSVLNGVFPSSVDIFSMLSDRPAPVKDATVEVNISGEETLKFTGADVTVSNFSSYSTKAFSITSDDNITVRGFSGETVFSDGSVEFDGKASGYVSSGVNSSSNFGFKKSFEPNRVVFTGVRKLEVGFSGVTGSVDTESISTRINSSDININSFSGNITVSEGDRFLLEGRIHTLESGDLTVGGGSEEN